jgi:hypothetical protein
LAYRVVPKFKGANVDAYHAGTWKRCEFAVGRTEAGNVKIAIVKLLVIRITKCAQRRCLVALERGDRASSIALASSAVPNCSALTKLANNISDNVAYTGKNEVLRMAFSRDGFRIVCRPLLTAIGR